MRIRRGLTYTNVTVTLALVFAMTGGAYAASKYLITSTTQISPRVLSQLSEKAKASDTAQNYLPAGKTEIGVWGFSLQAAGVVREPLSFPIPLTAIIGEDNVDVIEPGQEGKQFAKECPGTIAKPAAIPGYLCLYSSMLEAPYVGDGTPRTGGVVLAFYVAAAKNGVFGTSDEGTWAVSSPRS